MCSAGCVRNSQRVCEFRRRPVRQPRGNCRYDRSTRIIYQPAAGSKLLCGSNRRIAKLLVAVQGHYQRKHTGHNQQQQRKHQGRLNKRPSLAARTKLNTNKSDTGIRLPCPPSTQFRSGDGKFARWSALLVIFIVLPPGVVGRSIPGQPCRPARLRTRSLYSVCLSFPLLQQLQKLFKFLPARAVQLLSVTAACLQRIRQHKLQAHTIVSPAHRPRLHLD